MELWEYAKFVEAILYGVAKGTSVAGNVKTSILIAFIREDSMKVPIEGRF